MTATTAADLAAEFAWQCDGAKETGGDWWVRCPAHDDHTPSLKVTPKTDRILLKCFAGCENKTILDTMGLGWDALFVQPRSTEKWQDPWAKLGKVTGRYDYTDAHGTVVHQTVRFRRDDGDKDMRQHRPDPAHPGRWLRRVKDITQVLYHLPAVITAIAGGELVYLVEGEKDADSLEALGLTATTNAGGSKSWKPHYDDSLRGAHLVCLPDFDPAGQQHMANVVTRLQGSAASIKLLTDIHTEKRKSDVSDWLAEGHTLAELEAAVEACPMWTPGEPTGEPARTAPAAAPSPQNGTAPSGSPEATVTLMMSKEKRPHRVLGNVLAVLTQDAHWQGVLGYNAFADEVVFLKRPPCSQDAEPWKGKPLEDQDDAEIANWLHWQYELFAPTTVVHEAVQAAAHRNPFHPIRDYLARLRWDQTPRLDRWLSRYCGVADSAYARAVAASTLIGAVARVQDPGAKMDTVTILFGKQGTRKSTTWRVLCGDAWFSDTMGDLHDKDAMMALRGKWIIEFGDLAAVHRSEIETVKRFVSATQDYYRPSYGRRPRTFLRQNIFVGSTNRPDALKDDTGNRRFYIVTTTGICDTEALEQDRNQLWAEAAHRYHTGELWYLDAMMAEVAAQVQADHMEHDPWEETVLEYVTPYAGIQHVTTKQIMCEAFLWVNPDKWTLANTRRIGAILHNHGWQNSRPRNALGKQYAAFWHPPDRPSAVTDGTEVPWPVGVGNAVIDSRIGNTIGNTQSPHEIRPATDVTDVTDHFSHTQAQQNNQAAQHNQAALYKYGDPIGNIGNIGNKRIPTSGNAGTDAVTDAAIGTRAAPAPCQHLDTSMQGAGLVCTRCGAALF